jgi:hypothetical protein
MSDNRLAHLWDVAPALWPAPHVTSLDRAPRDRPATHVEEFLLLPSSRRPRLLTPTGRRAAAAVVRHHGEGRGRSGRALAATLSLGLRAGLGSLLWRERLRVSTPVAGSTGPAVRTLAGHLSDVLGRHVVMGMHLGRPRANRKPVLQLLTPDGRTLAYAKLGVDDLTDSLVQAEVSALGDLAGRGMRLVCVPELLHAGRWHGHELLVQSALPVWELRRPLPVERLIAAAAEISALGRVNGVVLGGSPFWAELTDRVHALPSGEPAERLTGLVHRLGAVARTVPVSLGGAHGDWAPWNMASVSDRLLVWDWERFRHHVPVGFDLLHHALQHDLVVRADDPAGAAHRLVDDAAARLAPLGQAPHTALVTASLYLADLAARYLADHQLEAGARLGDVSTYLLPALDLGIGRLEGEHP